MALDVLGTKGASHLRDKGYLPQERGGGLRLMLMA